MRSIFLPIVGLDSIQMNFSRITVSPLEQLQRKKLKNVEKCQQVESRVDKQDMCQDFYFLGHQKKGHQHVRYTEPEL